MKTKHIIIAILASLAALLLTSCADTVTATMTPNLDPVGFWYGLWHGAILPFAWVGSLFSSDISVYALYNNGGWYDFGFVWGTGVLTGSVKGVHAGATR